jgi:hypothetical protein
VAKSLLVSALNKWQLVTELIKCLAQTGNVAVTKDAHCCGNKSLAHAVTHRVLSCDVLYDSLRNG